jgi:hypothetical protein
MRADLLAIPSRMPSFDLLPSYGALVGRGYRDVCRYAGGLLDRVKAGLTTEDG